MVVDLLADILGGTGTLLLTIVILCSFVVYAAVNYAKGLKWRALVVLVISGFLFLFVPSLLDWVRHLGVDSFVETKGFDYNEALFLLKTVGRLLRPMTLLESFVTVAATGFVFWVLVVIFSKGLVKFKVAKYAAMFAGWSAFGILCIHYSASYLSHTALFEGVRSNFSNQLEVTAAGRPELNVYVYIGESTTSANWQLYGYTRPTTPQLLKIASQDNGLLTFHNVLSTHTHTSQSLLRALSFSAESAGNTQPAPIYRSQRTSIVSALKQANVKTHWFSNQSQTGSNNMVSSIIARQSDTAKWSTDSRFAPNVDKMLQRPYDHEFFFPEIDRLVAANAATAGQAVFLHSYAGHGPYEKWVPGDRREIVDEKFEQMASEGVVGELHKRSFLFGGYENKEVISEIEAYDKAIRYIDFELAHIIERLKDTRSPSVLVYFSDHGESVFTGRGHTVSRYIHEMVRVPFLMYFNSSAAGMYPDLFREFSALAASRKIATLAQFPETLMKLFAINHSAPSTGVVGEGLNDEVRHIVNREVYGEVAGIDLLAPVGELSNPKIDIATKVFLQTRRAQNQVDPYICYHRSNSFAKAWRGALVSSCLEFDIVTDEGGKLNVVHPPKQATGFDIGEVMQIALNAKVAVWIDAKNIHEPKNCAVLLDYLTGLSSLPSATLVEFPAETNESGEDLLQCAANLKRLGVFTSYYVPTKLAVSCANELQENKNWSQSKSCSSLQAKLLAVANSREFTDFSFSIKALLAMKTLPAGALLKWNTWGIGIENLSDFETLGFRYVIINTKTDPNGY